MPPWICCLPIGYSAAEADSAATAATAAAPPRTKEEIRIETPCFYQTGIDFIGTERQQAGCKFKCEPFSILEEFIIDRRREQTCAQARPYAVRVLRLA